MELHELIRMTTLINRLAKRALFAEEQIVALEGQCAEWKRIADELKAERNAAKQEAVSARQDAVTRAEADRKRIDGLMIQAQDMRAEIERLKKPRPPEASHITPEGKRTAEGAVEPKPGDVVRLVRVPTLKDTRIGWEPNWGGIDDHMRVHYVGSNITGIRVVRAVFGLEWPVSCVEVVKGADK